MYRGLIFQSLHRSVRPPHGLSAAVCFDHGLRDGDYAIFDERNGVAVKLVDQLEAWLPPSAFGSDRLDEQSSAGAPTILIDGCIGFDCSLCVAPVVHGGDEAVFARLRGATNTDRVRPGDDEPRGAGSSSLLVDHDVRLAGTVAVSVWLGVRVFDALLNWKRAAAGPAEDTS